MAKKTSKNIKIGITGSTGVLGSILTKKLRQKKYNISVFQSDICDFLKVRDWIKNHNFSLNVNMFVSSKLNLYLKKLQLLKRNHL